MKGWASGNTRRTPPRRLFSVTEFVWKLLSESRVLRQMNTFNTFGRGVLVAATRALKWESLPLAWARTVHDGCLKSDKLESPRITFSLQLSKDKGAEPTSPARAGTGVPKRSSWTEEVEALAGRDLVPGRLVCNGLSSREASTVCDVGGVCKRSSTSTSVMSTRGLSDEEATRRRES